MRVSRWRGLAADAATYVGAIALALAASGVFIVLVGGDVLGAYATVVRVSMGSLVGLGQTMNKMTPLLFGSLAVAFAFKGGLFNIGVDGQIYLGAIAATGVAFALAGLPAVVLVPLVLVAGIAGGAAWGAVPGALRAGFGVNEIFVTVMLNFVAQFFTEYLATGPWNDPMAGEAITRAIVPAAQLPMLLPRAGAHVGILLALAVVGLVAFLLYRTLFGFQVRAAGDNPRAARLGGINVPAVAATTMVVSGAIAGLAGAVEVSGFHYRLILGLTPGYGIMAILVAFLARGNPWAVAVVSFLFAALLVGSDSLQRSIGLPASAVFVFQALIVLAVLLAEAARRRRAS